MWCEGAFGKIILLGEHSVVYGGPALCAALTKGVLVESTVGTGCLAMPEWNFSTPSYAQLLQDPSARSQHTLTQVYFATAQAVFSALDVPPGKRFMPRSFTARFQIPTGSGLGSSAALSVALVRALFHTFDTRPTPQQIDSCALVAETVFHGNPSGLDHTVARAGGCGLFSRSEGFSPLKDVPAVRICVADSGLPRDTKGCVAAVRDMYVAQPRETLSVFTRIGRLVERAAEALLDSNWGELGHCMTENQLCLQTLGVSNRLTEVICEKARLAGAAGAKLTGGGRGGCIIALPATQNKASVQDVLAVWREMGLKTFVIRVGGKAESL